MLTRVRSRLQVMQIGAAAMSPFPVMVVERRALYPATRRHRLIWRTVRIRSGGLRIVTYDRRHGNEKAGITGDSAALDGRPRTDSCRFLLIRGPPVVRF